MKKMFLAIGFILMWCTASCVLAKTELKSEPDYEKKPVIIAADSDSMLQDEHGYCELSDKEKISEGEIKGKDATYYSAEITYDSAKYSLQDILVLLSTEKNIITAEEDFELSSDGVPSLSTDPYMREQWHLQTIGVDKEWEIIDGEGKKPGEGVVVAVVDTGVDYNHRDLLDSMWINYDEYYGTSGRDDDNNGVIDDIYGANFSGENTNNNWSNRASSEGNPADTDPNGHGTHVAGIIAMTANNGGAVGIAYGVKIMAVKAGDSTGYFKVSNVLKALNYAVMMDADVINMSFGTYGESAIIKAVLEEVSKECIVVAASGNDGLANDESDLEDAKSVYPASYPFVIGVMATDKDNNITSWSNYDALPNTDNEYEIAAPGHAILSTIPNNQYAYMSGTSMAAPMVSAAAAILLSELDIPDDTNPIKYVFNHLVHSGENYATKTEETGRTIQYPLLNIYHSINSEHEPFIEFSKTEFYDCANENLIEEDKEYIVEGDSKINIECAFFLKNTDGDASDVSVKLSVDNENCSIENDSLLEIGQMLSGAYLDISHNKEDTFIFTLNGEKGKTYDIPVKLTVEWDGGKNEITRNLKVTFKEEEQPTPTPVISVVETVIPVLIAPQKPEISPVSSFFRIKWDKLPDVEEYIIYRSENNKDNYSILASVKSVSGTSYIDVNVSEGIKYYYKIKAVYNDIEETDCSEDAYIIKPAKIKKLKKSGKKLTWQKAKGAKKYYIYYSYRKNSRFKKLAIISGKKRSYKIPDKYLKKSGRIVHFKVCAMAKGSNGKVFGNFSSVVK